MRIGLLTQYYPPEVGAPQRRLSDLVRRLRDAGHHVEVLTAMPNYPQGKIYDGYRGLYRLDEVESVKVHRAYIYPARTLSFLKRVWNYLSFVLSALVVGIWKLPCDLEVRPERG